MKEHMENLQKLKACLCNMDGVIFHEDRSLSGALDFVKHLNSKPKHVLFLTNSSHLSPGELREELISLGVDLDESTLHTSALTIVEFLAQQASSNTGFFMIGEANVLDTLHEAGSSSNESSPDYVVIGFNGESNRGVPPTLPFQPGSGLSDLAKRCGRGPGQGFYRR